MADRGFGLWIDSRWDQPLDARGALWDTWMFGLSAKVSSTASGPLSGEITATGRTAVGSVVSSSIPVSAFFRLANPTPLGDGSSGVSYPPFYWENAGLGSAGSVHLGLYRDTLVVSSENVLPFGERGPDWFVYSYLLDWGSVRGQDLYTNPVEHTARCDANELIRRCFGEFRSGYYWYNGPDGGSYVTMILSARRTMPARIEVRFDAPQGGLGLGEQTPVRVSLKDAVAPIPAVTPVTVWFDRTGSTRYGELVADGQRGDTLHMTLGEVQSGGVSFKVRDEPASFGFQVRIRVEPDFDATLPPAPGYGDLYIHGATLALETRPALPEVEVPATLRGSVEDWPAPDPSAVGTLGAYTYDSAIEIRLTNTRTGESVQAPAANGPAIAVTLDDVLSGRIEVTGFGEVTHTEPRPYGRPAGEFVGLLVQIGDPAVGTLDAFYDLFVQARQPLSLTADPDSVAAGGEARFTLEAPGLDPATPVTFTVPDLTLGGFVADAPVARGTAARGADVQRVASVTKPLSEVASVRFLAAEDVDSTQTVTVTATAGGRTGEAMVTVRSNKVIVRLIRQNDTPVPTSGSGAYLMVSKVRPDWLLPSDAQEYASGFGKAQFLNVSSSEPQKETVYDPHTYRVEIEGLPDSLTTPEMADRMRFTYEVIRNDGASRSAPRPVASAEARAVSIEGGVVGTDSTGTQLVRSKLFHRLVSNGVPNGNRRGPYDDEIAGEQTILVTLGDSVRVTAFVETAGSGRIALGKATLPVGQNPAQNSVDAIRHVALAWHVYGQPGNRVPASNPAEATRRASEDWAQASISFRENESRRTTFLSSDIGSGFQIEVNNFKGRTSVGGVLDVTVSVPQVGQVEGRAQYEANVTAGGIAEILAEDLNKKLPSGIRALWSNDGSASDGSDFGLLLIGRRADSVVVSVPRELPIDIGIEPGMSDLGRVRTNSGVAYLIEAAVKDLDAATIDVVVVPENVIKRGRGGPSPGLTAEGKGDNPNAIAASVANTILLPFEAADGDDRDYPLTLGHELGHVLMGLQLPREAGETPSPRGSTDGEHTGVSYNLMYYQTLPNDRGGTDDSDGRKRLTLAQQIATRCESGSQADDVTAELCQSLYPAPRFDRATGNPPLLYRP